MQGTECIKLVDIYCIKIGSLRTSCSVCASGYRIVSDRCRICEVPGCKVCSTNIGTCDECYEGQFKSSSTSCTQKCSVSNCANCQAD